MRRRLWACSGSCQSEAGITTLHSSAKVKKSPLSTQQTVAYHDVCCVSKVCCFELCQFGLLPAVYNLDGQRCMALYIYVLSVCDMTQTSMIVQHLTALQTTPSGPFYRQGWTAWGPATRKHSQSSCTQAASTPMKLFHLR